MNTSTAQTPARAASALRPLYDRVALRRAPTVDTTPGGLHIPDNAKAKPQEAEVVAVGTGRVLDSGEERPCSVRPGDRVLVGLYAGVETEVAGEKLVIVREDEILAVVG